MGSEPLSADEAVLVLLRDDGPSGSATIAGQLGLHERTARRRLTRLIKDGYAFSPTRAVYRITAAGVAAIAPIPDATADPEPGKRLLDRRWGRR